MRAIHRRGSFAVLSPRRGGEPPRCRPGGPSGRSGGPSARQKELSMRIAMVSEHASPLAAPGGPDAGGQNVHVRELAIGLARAGHAVTVHTRRDDPDLPDTVELSAEGGGALVHHVPAGPPVRLPKDRIVTHVPKLAQELEDTWRAGPPALVHAPL